MLETISALRRVRFRKTFQSAQLFAYHAQLFKNVSSSILVHDEGRTRRIFQLLSAVLTLELQSRCSFESRKEYFIVRI